MTPFSLPGIYILVSIQFSLSGHAHSGQFVCITIILLPATGVPVAGALLSLPRAYPSRTSFENVPREATDHQPDRILVVAVVLFYPTLGIFGKEERESAHRIWIGFYIPTSALAGGCCVSIQFSQYACLTCIEYQSRIFTCTVQ